MHVFDPFGCLNLLDGLDLIWVCLNLALRHKEPEKLAGWDAKDTLPKVQFEIDLAQVSKSSPQVLHECCFVLGFDHYVIHISFYISM